MCKRRLRAQLPSFPAFESPALPAWDFKLTPSMLPMRNRQSVWPKLTSLTSLNVSGCPGLSDLSLSMISRIGSITELDISGLHGVSEPLRSIHAATPPVT